MDNLEKLIDFLRNNEVNEKELRAIYTSFFRKERARGFNNGCEFIRRILRNQKMCRRQNIKKKFSVLSEQIEEYLHESA